MAYVIFSPKTTTVDLSSTKSRTNFQTLINDFNNGLLDRGDTANFSGLHMYVHDVKKDQTVSAKVAFYNQTATYSFTSKYEDTVSRPIYKSLSIPVNATALVNHLKGNGGNLDATITSGTTNFNTPVTVDVDFRTKEIAGVKSGQVTISGSEVDKSIRVTRTDNVNGIYIELDSYNGKEYVELFKGASNGTFIDIPAGTIADLSLEYYIWVYAGLLLESNGPTKLNEGSDSAFLKFKLDNLTVSNPTISNLATVGEYWEKPITVNWRSTYQEGYEWEAYYNNEKVSNGTGGTSSSFSIPANTFRGPLPASVRVRVYRTYAGVKYYSGWQEVTLSLKDIEATISNLLIEGEYWESPIKVSWQSTNQQQFKVEVLKSNQVVKTYTGTTATSYTIPAEQLTEGQHTIRVTVAYSNRYVNSSERTVTLKDMQAVVSSLALSGSNIDLELAFSWISTNQQKYEAEIYKDDVRVKNYSGTTATSVVILNSSLTTGLHRFRVRVAFKDRWTEWKEITATLTETLPSIGALEPDGVITERDDPTRVWWTSQNQSKWELVIDGSITYTGTTEKEKILAPGALQTGKHSMLLTVTYRTSAGVEKHVNKKAEWIVQGRPPTPTITSSSTFTTSRPTIVWDTQDQQGYILEVLRDNEVVYSTDWINGLYVQHKIETYLSNGSYIVRVKVMNQFSLESDWGAKQITVNAVEPTNITLTSNQLENAVNLSWDNPNNRFIKFYVLRNGELIAKTTETFYVDYIAHRDCVYTVRGITEGDIYKDSNQKQEFVEISRSVLATVDKLEDQLNCAFFTSSDRFNANLGLECTLIEVSGRPYPIAVFGEHQSKNISLNLLQCDSLDKLIEMFHRREVFCYRDHSEKVFFVIPSLPYNRNSILSDHEGTISAMVVDYKERVDYE